MAHRRSTFAWTASLAALVGCNPAATGAAPATDAGTIPPSAYAECNPSGSHDAATFTFTATCSALADDGGGARTCAEWSEGADGDWTPFVESCFAEGGTIESTRCPEAGLGGTCALPASCTTQTTVFYYGSANGPTACAAKGGSFAP